MADLPPTQSRFFSSYFPSWGGLVFVAPSLWPVRVNESHVFDDGEQFQSRNTAMEAFLQESILNSGKDMLEELELLSLLSLSLYFAFSTFSKFDL